MKSGYLMSVLLYLLLFLFGEALTLNAQEERFKAIYIYNFTKYVNWSASEGDFVIAIMGSDLILRELDQIATKKTVGNAKIGVKKVLAPSDITDCQILFVASGKSSLLPEVFQIAKKNNILVISEKVNSCKSGSCINFLTKDGKLIFEISTSNIELCGLEISSDLLNLGQLVDRPVSQ